MESETHLRRLPSLDGLRAISIAMVVIGHASATAAGFSRRLSTFLGWIGTGGLGVSIFFVISGFLITTLLADELRAACSINLANFYLRRAFRILPAFCLYWLFVLALSSMGLIRMSSSDLFSSATYIWNYTHRTVDTWFLGHTWSLSLEEQFYLLWPIGLKLLRANRAKWVAVAAIILAPFLRIVSYVLFPSTRPLIGMMLHTRADSLMIGALLALLTQDSIYCAMVKHIAKSAMIPSMALCFAAIDTLLTRHFKGAYLLTIGYTIQNMMIALLVAHVVFYDKTRLARFLNGRTLVHLGTISYSLYLWQQLFLTPRNTTFTGIFPLNILFAVAAAELSYHIIERPFLKWRNRFSSGRDYTVNQAITPETGAIPVAASTPA